MADSPLSTVVRRFREIAAAQQARGQTDGELLRAFTSRGDQTAFAVLVRRHGKLVLSICRRVLHHLQDAEDAFQATFLVLARRAGSIRKQESLAGWLHGVAYRMAHNARKVAARRQRHEARARVAEPSSPEWEAAWREVQVLLDEEVQRLPAKYREPFVLCCLEHHSGAEAATRLSLPEGTVRSRLAEARKRLQKRLQRRGVELPAVLGMAALAKEAMVAVPAALSSSVVRSAAEVFAGESLLAAGVSTPVAALMKGATKAMILTKMKIGLAAVMVGSVLAAATGLGAQWALIARETVTEQASKPQSPKQPKADLTQPPRTDLSGDPLPDGSTLRFGTSRYRHGSPIHSMAVSADGKLAVTASGSGSFNPALAGKFSPARVFDLTDGRCLYSIPNEREEYTEAVGLSPDGKILATKDGKFLTFWDAATGKELRKLNYSAAGGGRSVPNWMTFTPDGKQIAVTLMGQAVQLVDVETATVVKTFATNAAASGCVFSPDGKLMATGGYESENKVYFARLWEVATGKEIRRFAISFELNRSIEALAFSHDGTKLAGSAWRDGQLRVFEVATGKELNVFPKIGESVRGIAFAPDGKTVAAAGDNIHLYDLAAGKERLLIDWKARTLVFSQDGSVLTGAVGGAIYRWDAASGRQLTPAAAQDSAVEQILVSAVGRSIFTTDQDGDLHVWDTVGERRGVSPTGPAPRRIAGGIKRGVVASADRRFLAWTVQDVQGNSRIRLYDIAADRFVDRVALYGETVVAFQPDGKTLLTLGGEPAAARLDEQVATVRLWDIESGKQRRSFPVATKSDPKVPRAAPAEDPGVPVRLWDVTTGKAGHELSEPMNGLAVPDETGFGTIGRLGFYVPFYTTRRAALSPDGKTFAIGPDWADAFGNRDLRPPDGRAFSPDGRFLVDWAENPYGPSRMDHVYVWEAATGRAVATLVAPSQPSPTAGGVLGGGAAHAAFAPDSRTLATASADGVVRLWEVATWKVRAEFRGHRDRVTAVTFGPDGRLFTGGLDTVVLGWDVQPPRDAAKGTFADTWEALAHPDAKSGFQAQGRFLAEPGEAVKWFAARVTPAVQPDPARVKALIADLDNQDFATRERATTDLQEHGAVAAAALREVVADSSSAEVRRRAEGMLRDMANGVIPPRELRAVRAVEVLEWIATKEARAHLIELAKGAPEARLTQEAKSSLERLARRTAK